MEPHERIDGRVGETTLRPRESRFGFGGWPIPRGFRGVGGFDFSGKEVKTPTLPKAGRVGQPENLNRQLGVDVLQCYHPTARVHQLKACGRVGHPPGCASQKDSDYNSQFLNESECLSVREMGLNQPPSLSLCQARRI